MARTASARTASAMASTGASRPSPTSPQASSPRSGSTTTAPRARSVATFSCVASARHMCDVHRRRDHERGLGRERRGREQVVRAARCELRDAFAVAGAITKTSASSASEMWCTRAAAGSSHSDSATGSPVSVRNVAGPTKCVAASVMTTFTRQPARMSTRDKLARLVRGDAAGHAEHDGGRARKRSCAQYLTAR